MGAISLTFALLSAGLPTAPKATPVATIAAWLHRDLDGPRVNVWMNRDDPYQRGDRARVYFRLDRDAYVTVVRIDTDGRIRILFPLDPWEDGFARGGKTFEVVGRGGDDAFRISDFPGVGYVFAISSDDPFDYASLARDDHWDYRTIADGRVRGDPYVAATDLAAQVTPNGLYDYDMAEYYVEQHYDYPRFVCYDCHSYAPYYAWDPYDHWCSRFRIVIYDDPFYYPYRYYRGTTVVFTRPYRPGPRYVFKDSDPRNDYLTRVAQRPRNGDRRLSPGDRTGVDVGGRGSIPTPVVPRDRRGTGGQVGQPGAGRGGSEPRRRLGDDGGQGTGTRQTPQDSPRRRSPSTGSDRSGGTRQAPSEGRRQGTDDTRQNNRPSENRNRRPSRESVEGAREVSPNREPRSSQGDRGRRVQPDTRREPSRTEPRRDSPRSGSRGESSRSRPERRESPRPEARREPSRDRPSPPARSTGEPELKRRRP